MKEKMLVTGANGFIGKAAMEYFLDKYDVYGLDIVGKKHDKLFIVNMLSDDFGDVISEITPEIIVHAAGGANVSASFENPKADFQNSLYVLYNLLDVIRLKKIQCKIIFLSSAAVYGNVEQLPILENNECNPISPYGLHKKFCEETILYYNKNYHMDIQILRIFSAFGPGLKKQLLWDLYKKFMDEKKDRVELFGTGEETRDFIFIDDIMQCIEKIIETKQIDQTIFNIANGEAHTVRKVAEVFETYLGSNKKIFFNNVVRKGDPRFWRADIGKISELGYKRTVELEEGIRRYIEWARDINI